MPDAHEMQVYQLLSNFFFLNAQLFNCKREFIFYFDKVRGKRGNNCFGITLEVLVLYVPGNFI